MLTLFGCQERLIFPGWGMRALTQGLSRPADVESLWIDIESGEKVEAWFALGRGRSAANPGPLVLATHGNAEVIDSYAYVFDRYRELGVSLLLPEYRGYGRSGGRPGQAQLVADAVRFHDLAVARPEVDATRVLFHGRSIGGAVVAQLAAQRRPAAMILESSFTSMDDLAAAYWVPSLLVRHPFRTIDVVRGLDVPMLLLHGAHDEIIPVSHGRRLAAAARRAQYVELDCGHNDMLRDVRQYWGRIEPFLREHGLLESP